MYHVLPYNLLPGIAPPLTAATLKLTYRCNLRCEMCWLWRKDIAKNTSRVIGEMRAAELSYEELCDLVDQLAELGCKTITITGGEPFLRDDLIDLIGYIKKKRVNSLSQKTRPIWTILFTNGTLIDKNRARQLIDSNVDQLGFSLDGPKKVHDRIRGSKGCFEQTFRSIKYVEEACAGNPASKTSVIINCAISARNVDHLDAMVHIASRLGVDELRFAHLSFVESAVCIERTNQILSLQGNICNFAMPEHVHGVNIRALMDQIEKIKRISSELGLRVRFVPNLTKAELVEYYGTDGFAIRKRCLSPWSRLIVDPYGEVYACRFIDYSVGNIRSERIDKIWNNDRYRRFRKLLKKEGVFPICGRCCKL